MPNDFLTISTLAKELNNILQGGKLEKIYQPERDEISLAVHTRSGKLHLVISCNAQAPRIHISTTKKENPVTAPTFCMRLRKLLGSGIVQDVSMLNDDRIIGITIISKNELKDTITYRLIFEMMGRYSNIILIGENNTILDAVKQVSYDTATKRCLMPGTKYDFPEQNKLAPQDYEGLRSALRDFNMGTLPKYICAHLGGISLDSATELCGEYCNAQSLDDTQINTVIDKLKYMYNILDSGFAPCVALDDNGNAIDYYIYPYAALTATSPCQTLSLAIESCVQIKDHAERHRERTKHLYNALKKYVSRNQKKLEKAFLKQSECQNMDTLRKYGELLMCNLGTIKRGDKTASVIDYYLEDSPTISIPLDVRLSPAQCAQDYYKRYNKLKRTAKLIGGQIEETKHALEYAKTIEASLATSSTQAELYQIEDELYRIGALKKLKTALSKSVKAAQPFIFEYQEFVIMAGKNNIQNDRLTFKLANGGDMWLHTLDYHGSHVIIFAENRPIPDSVIEVAAEIAAYYSSGRDNDKVAVDYTLRKFVKKNPSGNMGMVTYTDQSTAYVKPQEHGEYLTK